MLAIFGYAFAALVITSGVASTPSHRNNYVCGNPPSHMTNHQRQMYFDACWTPGTYVINNSNNAPAHQAHFTTPPKKTPPKKA